MYRKGALLCSLVLVVFLAGCGDRADAPAVPAADRTAASTVLSASPSAASREIPFTVGASVRTHDPSGMDGFSGRVIRSREALEALELDDACPLDRYTGDYFADKALLVLYVPLESGSMQLQFDGLTAQDDLLTVRYTTIRPNPSTGDMAYWQVLLEADAEAVGAVRTVTGERRRVTTSSTR